MIRLQPFDLALQSLFSALIALVVLTFASATAARASCNVTVTSGPGPAPWCTYATWSGPSWTAFYPPNGHTSYAQPTMSSMDLDGDGLSDMFYYGTDSSIAVVRSTGTSFATVTLSNPAVNNCYVGNFDGTGRSGIACQQTFASSTGTGYGSFVSKTQGDQWGWISMNPATGTGNPCEVMDVNGDGRDDIVCGVGFVPEGSLPA
jgi:hypothetical protein